MIALGINITTKYAKRKSNIIPFLLASIIIFMTIIISPASSSATATGFNPGRIIDDAIFTNKNSMSSMQIQNFLNSKVTVCDTSGTLPASDFGRSDLTHAQYAAIKGWQSPPYICLKDFSENGLSAAQIIYNTSQQFQINPQVLIVLLQKEQGLVTDAWPVSGQYRSATGYGCPDTAACDSEYYGFTNQVTWAARMFRSILNESPTWYSPYVLGNNYIQYNPNSSCGGSIVNIQNRSTQALYNYTPYQPNQAALDAGYGSVNCGAYGNRNFYLYFTGWFGSPYNDISLQKGSNNITYVVYDNKKQSIASNNTLVAWGLDKLPVYTVSDIAIESIADGGPLNVIVKNPNNPSMILLGDGSGFYNAWPESIINYGLDPTTASTITPRLLSMSSWSKNLSSFIETPSIPGVFLVDNGTYHSFSSWNSLVSWAGKSPNIINISNNLFSLLTQNPSYGVLSGQAIDSNGDRYLIDSGRASPLTGSLSSSYPNDRQVVIHQNLLKLIPKSLNLYPFIKSSTSNTIYIIDSQKKLGFSNGEAFSSFYKNNTNKGITTLSQTTIDSIPNGNTISSRFVYNSSNPNLSYYVFNSAASLSTSFATINYGTPLSEGTLADLNISNDTFSCGYNDSFIKATNTHTVFMLENGIKRPISNPYDFILLNSSGNVCELNKSDVDIIPTGPIISPFVQYNGGYYLLEDGKKYTANLSLLQKFGANTASTISSQTFSAYVDAEELTSSFVIDGEYYLVRDNKYHKTTNAAIAQMWNISPQIHSKWIVGRLNNGGELSQYTFSSDVNDKTIYMIDSNIFYAISNMNALINTGALNKNIITTDSSYISSHRGQNWHGYLAIDSSSTIWILDGGVKRKITSNAISSWTNNQTPTLLSDQYLSLMTQGLDVTHSVKINNQNTIYAIIDGKKCGISSIDKYINTIYDPTSYVTSYLFYLIPNGPVF